MKKLPYHPRRNRLPGFLLHSSMLQNLIPEAFGHETRRSPPPRLQSYSEILSQVHQKKNIRTMTVLMAFAWCKLQTRRHKPTGPETTACTQCPTHKAEVSLQEKQVTIPSLSSTAVTQRFCPGGEAGHKKREL